MRAALALLFFSLVLVQAVRAADNVALRVGDHPGYVRLVFNWPTYQTVQARLEGRELVLRFAEENSFDLRSVSGGLRGFAAAPVVSDKGRQMRFALLDDFVITQQRVGEKSVLDVKVPSVATPQDRARAIGPGQTTAPKENTAPPPQATPQGSVAAVRVRFSPHGDYDRVVFDWSSPVTARLTRSDNQLDLVFGRPAQMTGLARFKPLDRIASIRQQSPTVVRLALKGPASTRLFKVGEKVVIDIRSDQKAVPETPTSLATKGPKSSAPMSEASGADIVVPLSKEDGPIRLTDLIRKKKQKIAQRRQIRQAWRTESFVERLRPASGLIPIPAKKVQLLPPLVLRFNWREDVRAAAYQRGGSLWLVFDREGPANLEQGLRALFPEVETIESIAVKGATVLRFDIPSSHVPRLSRFEVTGVGTSPQEAQKNTQKESQKKQFGWMVDIRRRTPLPQDPIQRQVSGEGAETELFYLVNSARRLLSVPDERFGDRVVVAPMGEANTGQVSLERYAQFEVLPTFQGVVLQPLSEGLVVSLRKRGVRIASRQALEVSSADQRAVPTTGVSLPEKPPPLFDLKAARRGGGRQYEDNRRDLLTRVSSLRGEEQSVARLDLAEFYFAHGRMSEALGVLNLLDADKSRLMQTPQAQLLLGAIRLTHQQYDEAIDHLNSDVLLGTRDPLMWQAALAAAAQDWKSAAAGFMAAEGLLSDLPDNLRNQLYLSAAETFLEQGDVGRAQDYLHRLDDENARLSFAQQAQREYLEGLKFLTLDEPAQAREKWMALRHSRHRPTSARARYALLEQGLADGSVSAAEATETLEQLRFAWRGDSFEFILLNKLGELYAELGNYRKSLDSLRQAAAHFALSERADRSVRRMREIFEQMYLSDGGRAIPPLTAIALYQEFRELTPAGEKGETMITRLADRLVDVDLLEQAGKLLDWQIEQRLEGEEKSRVGGRLALISLLSAQPQGTLDALDKSQVDGVSESLKRQRRHLRARALADLKRVDDALALLEGDQSLDALRLAADINWRERRWVQAADRLGRLVPAVPPRDRVLSEDESQVILNLAIAQTLSGDREGLVLLTDAYKTAMDKTDQKTFFDLLTRDSGLGGSLPISRELAEVAEFEAFMNQIRQQVDDQGLSTVN